MNNQDPLPPVTETAIPLFVQKLSPTSAFSLFVKKAVKPTVQENLESLQSPRPSALKTSSDVELGRRVKLPPIKNEETRGPSPS